MWKIYSGESSFPLQREILWKIFLGLIQTSGLKAQFMTSTPQVWASKAKLLLQQGTQANTGKASLLLSTWNKNSPASGRGRYFSFKLFHFLILEIHSKHEWCSLKRIGNKTTSEKTHSGQQVSNLLFKSLGWGSARQNWFRSWIQHQDELFFYYIAISGKKYRETIQWLQAQAAVWSHSAGYRDTMKVCTLLDPSWHKESYFTPFTICFNLHSQFFT